MNPGDCHSIHEYSIPVDGKKHAVDLIVYADPTGMAIREAASYAEFVFWAEFNSAVRTKTRMFRVVATGEEFSASTLWHGTAVGADGTAYHLVEHSL